MIATIPQPRATLPALLAQRARHASDGRLALDVGGGLVIAAVALVLRPPGWAPLLSAALCFVAFGGWGISDRMLSERGCHDTIARLLRLGRGVAAVVGTCAAIALILTLFGMALGTWIS